MAFLFTPLISLAMGLLAVDRIVAMVILGIALSDFAVRGETTVWRLVRWGGRLSLIWVIVSIARAERSNSFRAPKRWLQIFSSARLAPEL